MVESQAFIRLNRKLQQYNNLEIGGLGRDWKRKMPCLEWMFDSVDNKWIVSGEDKKYEEETGLENDKKRLTSTDLRLEIHIAVCCI